MTSLDLVGIGIGPFNLSLAALLEKTPEIKSRFLDRKEKFDWHPELMFSDATMQTSYIKDLVTPVDPTNPNSFLNYLTQNDLFYPFVNTQRSVVNRREFEQYCQWVSARLGNRLQFNSDVGSVDFDEDKNLFRIVNMKDGVQEEIFSKNISVATGIQPRVPDCAIPFLGDNVFHAKSAELKQMSLEGKNVVIVGGGQTGIEIFRNALLGKWGRAADISVVTHRKTLEPLDESAFVNEYFTPNYVDAFWDLESDKKQMYVSQQKLASDGNTPSYLKDLFNTLYQLKYVDKDERRLPILACRKMTKMEADGAGYSLKIENEFTGQEERLQADIVILCTGFKTQVPKLLEPLISSIYFDSEGRFEFDKNYSIKWDGPKDNKIYALNFSRHAHGIVDPQTSLMAWRSAVVVNDISNKEIYRTKQERQNFVQFTDMR